MTCRFEYLLAHEDEDTSPSMAALEREENEEAKRENTTLCSVRED